MVPVVRSKSFKKPVVTTPGLAYIYKLVIRIEGIYASLISEIYGLGSPTSTRCAHQRPNSIQSWPAPEHFLCTPVKAMTPDHNVPRYRLILCTNLKHPSVPRARLRPETMG